MTLIHRIISAGFAVAALASASVPALAWTVWPDVDFEWYANVGKQPATQELEVFPAARPGYIWSPGHYERVGSKQTWVAGRWIRDDYDEQVAMYNSPNSPHVAGAPVTVEAGQSVATGPMTLRDSKGNVVPTNPDAYPVDSSSQLRGAPLNPEASSIDSSRR